MTLEEASHIIDKLDNAFDSHEFISLYMKCFTTSYSDMLHKHGIVPTAHGEIARFLRNNSDELHIRKVMTESSLNIYNNLAENAKWIKE